MGEPAEYDPSYLAGILEFNRRDFFEAHEIWEDLWQDCDQSVRRFYQGLIQAAVALHHWGNGNWRGAKRLFQSGRTHMSSYPEKFFGLNIARFWQEMECALADVLKELPPEQGLRLDADLCPIIALDPPPTAWPTDH